MTLESTINKNRYIGNGATTQFPFTFKAWKTDHILVFIGDGSEEQEVSTLCTIELTASGGTVTFPNPPASGTIIVIRRNMPYIQEDDYRNGTRFDAEEIEDRFDQDCAERQDLRLDVGRALKVPLTSEKTPEEYEVEFWHAFENNQNLHDDIVGMHADVMSERQRVVDEGDYQVQRVQTAGDSVFVDYGTGCLEQNWTLVSDVSANSNIDISPLKYIVGRHHIQVSVNGVRQYRTRQFNEVGADGTESHTLTTLVKLNNGDTINVWISHLSNIAETEGYTVEEKVKLLGIESGAQVNIVESVKVNGSVLVPVGKAVDVNVPIATTTSPKMNGVASTGLETKWAKGDHVHPSDTTKADKATTLAGYGITDAKIQNGTITLGSGSITPLTQHQDISGKADKATTLAGYGITDAKIQSGTITLGSGSITPLTQHQDISGKVDKVSGKGLSANDFTDALKNKLNNLPSISGLARLTTMLSLPIASGTEVTVPAHVVGSGLLMVYHNGVLCESGSSAQYVDFSSTSIKFNYNIPAGDTITAIAFNVSA